MSNIEDILENKTSFSEKIIQLAKKNDLSLLDSLSEHCKRQDIELEDAIGLLSNEFKKMLHKEAIDLNIIRSKNQKVRFDF